jgi:thiol-disulfide isomerase/thioredoxin
MLFLPLLLLHGCREDLNVNEYLKKVEANIGQIKSSSYFSTVSGSAPGDTAKFVTYNWYNKEYLNPADTFIGSTFAWFQPFDTSKMYYFYDGHAQAYIDSEMKSIEIDSFHTNKLPFRPIGPPFFNYTGSIIKYALETKDSIETTLKEYGDTIKFSLYIPHKVVEFFGKPVVTDDPNSALSEKYSRYDIWISKSDNLPYRYRRSVSHSTSWESCKNVRLNRSSIEHFIPSEYFPASFSIAVKGKEKLEQNDLEGKAAPDWTLEDSDGNRVALKDLKSKVLIIQFTGIGCGPCHASIPFLKRLVADKNLKGILLVSIETWSNNLEGIKRYVINNNLNYRFLMSKSEVTKSYQVRGVPSFYILDEKRIIRKIIVGYGKETTDMEIMDIIKGLI